MFGISTKKQAQKHRVLTVKTMYLFSREHNSWGKVVKVAESPYIAGTRREAGAKPFVGQGKAYMVVSDTPKRFWIDWIEAWEIQ